MATYTPVSKIIATTGATTNAGFTAAVAAQNTAVASAVTTALAVTGFIPNSLVISPAISVTSPAVDFLEIIQTLTYTTST